jgi:tetratricopeptide (TPR) repeat protein
MATSYHQLGMLAQDRGDLDEAERLYRQSLTINQRLGNQAGMATSWSQLANLCLDRGEPETAVGLHVRALAIRLRLGFPEAGRNVRVLIGLRSQLGDEAFLARAGEVVDQQSLDNLVGLLDRQRQPDQGAGPET